MTNQPLTARQLVVIILACAIAAWVVVGYVHSQHEVSRASQYAQCAEKAPWGWDCNADPTGYPR